VMMKI
jgi:hypothetical protein